MIFADHQKHRKATLPVDSNQYQKPSEKHHKRANLLTIKRVIATYINASPVSGTLS